jgi:hypothetical protein
MKTKNQLRIESELTNAQFDVKKNQLVKEIATKLKVSQFEVCELPDESIVIDNVQFAPEYSLRLNCYFLKHLTTVTEKRFKIQ